MKPTIDKEGLVKRYKELDEKEKSGAKLTKKESEEMRQIYFKLLEVELKRYKIQKAKLLAAKGVKGSNYTPPKKRRKKKKITHR